MTLSHERAVHPHDPQGAGGGDPAEQRDGGIPAAGRDRLAVTYSIGSRDYEFIGDRDTVIRGFLDSIRHGYFTSLPAPAIVACLDAIESAFDTGAIGTVDASTDTDSAAPTAADDSAAANGDSNHHPNHPADSHY